MTPGVSQTVRWTIEDLEGFPENSNRYEIIDGELFVTRSPHIAHQFVVGSVHAELRNWSSPRQLGMAVIAPGVIFSEADAVIPDVIWISTDRLAEILDESGYLTGAPELVVEVLSESAADKKRDRETKLKQYSVHGVIEYWIVDRCLRSIEVYRRENGILKKAMTLFEGDNLTSSLLPEFSCRVGTLFA
ncbi:MAG: Uma2 family endonuclease [Geitlerinemataceae cyanobacterium]